MYQRELAHVTPYLLLAVVVTVLALLGDTVYKHYLARWRPGETPAKPQIWRSPFDLVAAVALIGFAAIRYNVGTDYERYARSFSLLDTSDWRSAIENSDREAGYTVLMLAVKTFTDSPQALFWVAATLTVLPIYAVLKRYSAIPALSVFLYVCLAYAPSFNLLRQSIAAALIFLAWTYLGRRNWLFVTLTVLAGAMHVSAIFAAVAIFMTRRWKLSARTIVTIIIVALIGAATIGQAEVANQLLTAFNPRYEGYLQSGQTGLGAYLQIGAYVVLLVLTTVVGRKSSPLSDEDRQHIIFVVIGIAIMMVGTQALHTFRFSGYFLLFILLLVPNRIGKSKDKLLLGFLAVAGGGLYYIAYLLNYSDLIPYQTYLSFG
ncbi:EpsG family protein [Dietzia cercidiphylli]|uniref:EpsG family protein n=1 Tax=Dietzia cercidiphylli TaxID=498199 RepID=UPI003F7E532C